MVKTQITINDLSERVKSVKVVWDEMEVNTLLENGWVFLHAGTAHQDSLGYCAKPIFIVAKLK